MDTGVSPSYLSLLIPASEEVSTVYYLRNANNIRHECRTKHPRTKHPVPFFDTLDKASLRDLPTQTKHPMQFLSPWTKYPMPFLPPRTKHPMPFLPPRTKHPTLYSKPMKVHKLSHLVNCHLIFNILNKPYP